MTAGRTAHRLQASVGHYGLFNGRRRRREIYLRLRGFIAANEARNRHRAEPADA